MSSSGAGSQHVRPYVWGMGASNASQRSPASIRKRSGGAETNSTTTCEIGRPTMSDCLGEVVRASKKRSHAERGFEAVRRSRNRWQSVFGRKVGALAVACVVEEVGPPRLSDDDRPFAARAKVRAAEPSQSAAHGQAACGARSAISVHHRAAPGFPPEWRSTDQRRYEEKGTHRIVQKPRANVASGSGQGQ